MTGEHSPDAGIDILVDLAKSGQIDPWNVDILEVTDKYLRTLDLSREQDLRKSGRALFYAAVLLRLKSEALDEPEEPDDALEFDELDGDLLVIRAPAQVLDEALIRRTSTKQARRRPVTLAELISELQRLEVEQRERQERKRQEGIEEGGVLRRNSHVPSTPMEMAHDEDIKGDMERVALLLSRWIAECGSLTLGELLAENPDRVGTFLALLFLDAEGRVNLRQEAFYGEVQVEVEVGIEGDAEPAAA